MYRVSLVYPKHCNSTLRGADRLISVGGSAEPPSKKSPAHAGLRLLANSKLLASAASLYFPHVIVVRVADLGERVTERIVRQRLVDGAAGRH